MGWMGVKDITRSPPAILVVEDNPVVLRGTEILLRSWDYQPLTASDPAEAMRIVASGLKPDLALLDIDLNAEMNGIDPSRHLLLDQKVPVIFHTSHTDEVITDAVRHQDNYYGLLSKRNDSTALRSMVDLALRTTELSTQLQIKECQEEIMAGHIQEPVICTDAGGRILWSSESARTILNAGQSLRNQQVENMPVPPSTTVLRIPVAERRDVTLYRLKFIQG